MKQHVCSYSDARDEQLVAYLYEESTEGERITFERHLASCALCREELDALRGVRADLGRWASPEPSFSVTVPVSATLTAGSVVPIPVTPPRRPIHIPVWAQAAAAVLVVGVAAGAANLDISYSSAQGLSVRTGWRHPAPAPVTATQVPAPVAAPDAWKAELAALEQRLRTEMSSHAVAVAAPASDESSVRRLRVLVQESEQRQGRDLALRFAEMAREVESQRQADLVRIDRSLGLIQSRTGMEVMRTQQQVNSLAQRVSQRQ